MAARVRLARTSPRLTAERTTIVLPGKMVRVIRVALTISWSQARRVATSLHPDKAVLSGMANKHVDFLKPDDQKKWLQQRGWTEDGLLMWRDPDTGIRYGFPTALAKAKAGCRVPADYELRPQ
jgi:hypothetical protein